MFGSGGVVLLVDRSISSPTQSLPGQGGLGLQTEDTILAELWAFKYSADAGKERWPGWPTAGFAPRVF